MIKVGSIIKTPNDVKCIKTFISGNDRRSSFFDNVYEKDKNTNENVIKERYAITTNFQIKTKTSYVIDRIVSVTPKVMKDNKGKEYYNCCLIVELSYPNKKNYNGNSQYTNQNDPMQPPINDTDFDEYI